MLYLEHIPAPPLNCCIRSLWYARVSHVSHARERVLPTGRVQIILNLARDFLTDCSENSLARQSSPMQIIGGRSVYEIIDTADMADLIGIVFQAGGFSPFVSDATHLFSNRSVDLQDVWGGSTSTLRDRLRELATPQARLHALEKFLLQTFSGSLRRQPMVDFALSRFRQAPGIATVRQVAQSTGWSERRFSQIFREQVGFSPKVWTRILRFQRAVQQLHTGVDLPWADLALDCGFYDQSHFANEFRAFSGIDATTFSHAAHSRPWANHIPIA